MDNGVRTAMSTTRPEHAERAWAWSLFDPERPPAHPEDCAWKLGGALVAAPVVMLGGLSWLLATWAGSWFAPLVAGALLVPSVLITAWARRATGWVLLLTASLAAAAMVNWFGSPASPEHVDRPGETSQVSADPVKSRVGRVGLEPTTDGL